MRYVARTMVTGALFVGLAICAAPGVQADDSTVSSSVEQLNLDGPLTAAQAEHVAQHPRLAEFLERHPHLADELASHPNAARFFANHPNAAQYLANHPALRERIQDAATRWDHATPQQRADWLAEHPKAGDIHRDVHDLRQDQHDINQDRHDVAHDQRDINQDRHDVAHDQRGITEDRQDIRQDKQTGNTAELQKDRQDLHRDVQDKHQDVHDLSKDRQDRNADVHDLNKDRRDRNADVRDLRHDAGQLPPGSELERQGGGQQSQDHQMKAHRARRKHAAHGRRMRGQ